MRTLIIAIAAVLIAAGAATGTAVTIVQQGKKDNSVDFDNSKPPALWSGVDYGQR